MKRLTDAFKVLGQGGDTIVEVMVVLAVLGLSLSFSYATANHGLIQSRNAEEHSEALGIINSQIELVRQAFAQQTNTSALTNGTDFCMSNPADPSQSAPFAHNVPSSAATDSANQYGEYPAACTNSYYHKSVHYDTSDPANPFFDFRVRWDGLGTLGPQQAEMNYVIGPNSIAGSSYSDSAIVQPPPSLTITSPADESLTSGSSIPVTVVVNNLPSGATFASFVIKVTDTVTGLVTTVPVTVSGSTGTATVTMGPDTIKMQAAATIVANGSSTSPTSNTITITEAPNWSMWTINGNQYSSCSYGESAWNDGNDGCFKSGSAMYAWRNVNATYNFGDGTYSPSGSYVPAGKSYLYVTYNQYDNGSSLPPAGYSFGITVVVTYGDGTTSSTSATLPISSDRSSYDSVYSSSIPVNFAQANPTSIQIKWTNNSGNDPNLQIDQLQLATISNGYSTSTYSAPGNGFSACQDSNNQWECLTTGTSAYSWSGGSGQPNYVLTYPVIRNLTTSSKYGLTINYTNFANGSAPPPPNYSYNINVYVNGVKVASNLQLAASSSNKTYSTTLTGISGTPQSISFEWNNDSNPTINGTYYDANFQLNSFKLTAQ